MDLYPIVVTNPDSKKVLFVRYDTNPASLIKMQALKYCICLFTSAMGVAVDTFALTGHID
jgi:hypothetical protein